MLLLSLYELVMVMMTNAFIVFDSCSLSPRPRGQLGLIEYVHCEAGTRSRR